MAYVDDERTREFETVNAARRGNDARSTRAFDEDYERFRERQERKRTRSSRWSQRLKRMFIGEEGSIFWAVEQVIEWLKVAAESINSQLNRVQSRNAEGDSINTENRSRGRHAADD